MDRMIKGAITLTDPRSQIINSGPIDARSILFAIAGAGGFFLLGILCLSLSRFDASLASVWLPNASAVALLLVARLRNEVPIYLAMAFASLFANTLAGNTLEQAFIFSVANLVNVALVTWLTRRATGQFPDMNDLADLGHFLIYGGLVGPICSACLAVLAMPPSPAALLAGFSAWFLADSMGMILVVPAVLMLADAVRNHKTLTKGNVFERCALTFGGMTAVFFVFQQDTYPLLFLVPPITLLLAFRIGGLGTALYVPGVAIVSSWMTFSGIGPIVNGSTSEVSAVFIIQAFIAANFLTGLPIAAILGGRERLTNELARGRRELSLLAENVTDAVLRIDNHGTCTYASPSVSAVLGKQPSDLIGRPMDTITLSADNEEIEAMVARLQSGASEQERVTYRRLNDAQDGAPVFIEADCAIANDPVTGARSGVIISARDVTERVELELELTWARRKAENAAHAKSEFLANMSHEIRTPMNGVLGFAELMLQNEQSAEDRRHTQMIVQSGRSMMLLLNDILDLSKIEAGQISIDHSAVDICATIAECAVLYRASAEKKGLELTFHAPSAHALGHSDDSSRVEGDTPPLWIKTDGLRLRQIVLNLIGNAVKFTETGKIDITCEVVGEECVVYVRDTGIGISPSRVESIFAPFTQAESDTSRRFGGTGLGLAISGQLAGLLDGRIEVESEPGAGSTFRLILPARVVEPEVRNSSASKNAEPPPMPQSASVLLVEDHDVNRMLGVEMLERCGQSVAVAHDGNEAISMVMDSVIRGTPFDLVLMDIQMPGCDGYTATQAIRGEGIGANMMPIIALTANAFPEDVEAARKAGMQAHLAKPFVFADLARTLQRWLPTRIVETDGPGQTDAETPDDESNKEDTVQPPMPSSPTDESAPKHTPALLRRWAQRRMDAMAAVREALSQGSFSQVPAGDGDTHALARIVHKLAGTAGIFGEPELGDQAAALERALRHNLPGEVCEALARELLSYEDADAVHSSRLAG